jgi:hypothetical protein
MKIRNLKNGVAALALMSAFAAYPPAMAHAADDTSGSLFHNYMKLLGLYE